MVHKYQISGMACTGCELSVKTALIKIEDIINIEVSKAENSAAISMKKHIPIEELQNALGNKYRILSIENEIRKHNSKPTNSFNWSDFAVWEKAGFNTLNCLIGCSIGDFLMIIFLQYYYPETPMLAQMVLAIILGLITSIALETSILHYRENLIWSKAIRIAVGMSFLSMVAMEIAMTTTDFMITGGKMALSNPNYWLAFIPAAIIGFLTPLPYNYYQLKKHHKACH